LGKARRRSRTKPTDNAPSRLTSARYAGRGEQAEVHRFHPRHAHIYD
jgi:hypothetical protein